MKFRILSLTFVLAVAEVGQAGAAEILATSCLFEATPGAGSSYPVRAIGWNADARHIHGHRLVYLPVTSGHRHTVVTVIRTMRGAAGRASSLSAKAARADAIRNMFRSQFVACSHTFNLIGRLSLRLRMGPEQVETPRQSHRCRLVASSETASTTCRRSLVAPPRGQPAGDNR
jgi:hypothetical protein